MGRLMVVVALLVCASWASADSTQELLSACRDVAEAKIDSKGIAISKNFDSGLCWGAFGVYQRVTVMVDSTGDHLFAACVPQAVKRSQDIAIFVEFAKRHPERLHEEAFDVVMDALRSAFPCPKP